MRDDNPVRWSLLVLAVLCLLAVAAGVGLVTGDEDGRPLGWAIVGFFGAGVVVLTRKAFER